ncbi:MAG TPA: endonuclease/exonuclease/phosphatase family protein [Polyangia bacterium]|nr:endonuclease/exonuclease/phosphatase family protein [Polyangia bacterium]
MVKDAGANRRQAARRGGVAVIMAALALAPLGVVACGGRGGGDGAGAGRDGDASGDAVAPPDAVVDIVADRAGGGVVEAAAQADGAPDGGDGAGAGGSAGDGPDGAPAPDGSADGAADPTLKLVTFNIRYANAGDGANAWPLRRDLVFGVLRAQAPDSAGLQEALFVQVQDLAAALPEYQRIGVGRDDGATAGEFSAILYRAARFDVAASGTFWFSDTPDVPGSSSWGNASIRICTWGRFVERATRRAYYHFNVHLDNVSEPANEKSVQLLMRRIAERPVATDPFVVTGDFNSDESQPAVRYMTGAAPLAGMPNPIPLRDTFRALHPVATDVLTFHDFMGGTAGAKIDFIFMGPGESALGAEIDHTEVGGRFPSDHYPVAARVAMTAWQ